MLGQVRERTARTRTTGSGDHARTMVWQPVSAGPDRPRVAAVKNPVVLIGVAFGLFFLIAEPQGLATIVLAILEILRGFGESTVAFVTALF